MPVGKSERSRRGRRLGVPLFYNLNKLLLGYEPPSGVPHLTPCPQKILAINKGGAGVECERQASRRRGLSDYARKNRQNSRSKFCYPLLRTTERRSSSHPLPIKKILAINKGGQGWSATDFAVGVRNSDELLGCEPPSGVPHLTLAHKKYSLSIKVGQGWSATDFAVGVRNSDELLGYEPPNGIPHLTPCPQKISATINGYGYFWWAGVDSDHRSQVTTDLQSVPFGRSGTYPYMELAIGIEPTTC